MTKIAKNENLVGSERKKQKRPAELESVSVGGGSGGKVEEWERAKKKDEKKRADGKTGFSSKKHTRSQHQKAKRKNRLCGENQVTEDRRIKSKEKRATTRGEGK